ncbi:MAG: sugar phosphate isomerase/epimerase [Pirellulaceae bacterium]|nr:sugar phosphate isomerase/epimerase [Pirellulaceae bacterium]
MILGYNTNGLAHHNPLAALELLAETGYRCVGITIDHQWLSPFAVDSLHQRRVIAKKLQALKLSSVIETGARFLLDSRQKHAPSLVAPVEVASPRINLIEYACQLANEQASHCVSIWSGPKPRDWDLQQAWDSLAINLERVLKLADQYEVLIGFEPEPGMFVDTIAAYERLRQWVEHPRLKLTMDIGHLFCQGELPIGDYIHRCREQIINVHLEDMRPGVHEHLMFGDGAMHFPPIMEALNRIEYDGPVVVELSRHSHDAVNAVCKSFQFLSPLVNVSSTPQSDWS